MNDVENLEEPPPIHRYVPPVDQRMKSGVLAARSGRPTQVARTTEITPTIRTLPGTGVLVIAAALVILSVQLWIIHGLSAMRTDLADVRGKLKETRSSLAVVWQATTRLGEDHTERVSVLVDSLRGTLEQAQREAQFWQTNRAAYRKRLSDNDRAMRTMTNAWRTLYTRLEGQRYRLDALERTDRTHASAIEALNRRAQWQQDLSIRERHPTPSALRKTLARLDSDLAMLEQRMDRSKSKYAQFGTR